MRNLTVIMKALLVMCATSLVLAQSGARDLYQQGLGREAIGDCEGAIKSYERIVRELGSRDRRLAAQAKVHLGICWTKLGDARGLDFLSDVIANYRDQADMVAEARARLKSVETDSAAASPKPAVSRIVVNLPAGLSLAHAFRNGVELSPDGSRIAFVASANPGALGAAAGRRIYLKSTGEWPEAVPIAGTERGYNPFFSPDGESLAFFSGPVTGAAEIQINKVPLSGGTPVILARLRAGANLQPDNFGATWGSNGMIVFGSYRDGLQWIPEKGGTPQPLTQLNPAASEGAHRLPHFLPNGSGVLFSVVRPNPVIPAFDRSQIWLYSFQTRQRKLLIENAIDARYAGNNSLVFAREGKLFTAPFNLQTLLLTGPPIPFADGDGVTHATRNLTVGTISGAAQYAVSQSGSLLYAPGSVEPRPLNSVVLVDEKGAITALPVEPKSYSSARFSPDGQRILLESFGEDDNSVYDIGKGILQYQTGIGGHGDWSRDDRLALSSSREGGQNAVYIAKPNAPGMERLIDEYMNPAWAPNGRQLVAMSTAANSPRYGLYLLSLDNPSDIKPLIQSQTHNNGYAAISPDGQWLAYCSDESGTYQVFVQPFPGTGPRVLVSEGPGTSPAWSRDGQRLFFIRGGTMLSVNFKISDAQFVPDTPQTLFAGRFTSVVLYRNWDVASDGRFVMIQGEPQAETQERLRKIFPTTLRLVLNWANQLQTTSGRAR